MDESNMSLRSNKEDYIKPNEFKEFSAEKVKSKFQLITNYLFELYSGIITNEETDVEVFMITFRIIDYDVKIIENIKKYILNVEQKLKNNQKIFNFFLNRLGFCKIHNRIHFVYEKSNMQLLDFETLGENLNDKNKVVQKLFVFKSLVDNIKECHNNEIKLTLIHPNLIFIDQNNVIKMVDFIFPQLFKNYDFNSNLDIALYFGFFDLMKVNEIINELNDKKLGFKNDIILLCLILNFYFSKDTENNSTISYCKLMYELEKDYILKNTQLLNLLKFNQNTEIKNFILQTLKTNYYEIKSMKEAETAYSEMLNILIKSIKCDGKDCKEEAKNMKLVCFHLVCKKCLTSHKCSKLMEGKSEFDVQYNIYRNKIDELKSMANKITLPKQNFSKYFSKNIEPTFSKINEMHKKYEVFFNMNEQKLNNMIEVVENILLKKKNTEHTRIVKFKDDLKDDLKKIVTDVQENLLKQNEKNKLDSSKIGELNESKLSKPEIKKSIYEGILDKNVQNYDKLFETFDILNVLINKYENYLTAERDLKMHLNYNINIKYLLGKIYDKSAEFLNELKTTHFSKFINETKQFTDKLLESYSPFAEFEHLNILEELKANENIFIGTVELKQNLIIIYDINLIVEKDSQKNEKKITLIFPEDVYPKYIIPLSRWVNLKSKLVVSGGLYKNIEKLDIISKNVYYIDFEVEDENLQRNVNKLPDMLFNFLKNDPCRSFLGT